jgi:hypothetical protein
MSVMTQSARFRRRVRKRPSGENDIRYCEQKHWSNETSERQYFAVIDVHYDIISIRMLFNKTRDKMDEGELAIDAIKKTDCSINWYV